MVATSVARDFAAAIGRLIRRQRTLSCAVFVRPVGPSGREVAFAQLLVENQMRREALDRQR